MQFCFGTLIDTFKKCLGRRDDRRREGIIGHTKDSPK